MNIFSPAIKQLAHFRLFCNHFDTKTKKTQKSENHLQAPNTLPHPPPFRIKNILYFIPYTHNTHLRQKNHTTTPTLQAHKMDPTQLSRSSN